jgi:cellulose synthase/poly-beta-1,6-N-acetylglucosamine synthase-like glycosyltransferase
VLPTVTVVMPVRNERAYIARSLNAVLEQDYPSDRVEIVVADGMSTDGTREYVQSLQATHPNLRLIDNPGRTAPKALNLAIAASTGEIVVRVDGHCEIPKGHVRACVRLLKDQDVDGVGGPLETIGQTPISRVIAVAMSSRFGVGGSAFRTVSGRTLLTDTVAFPAYKRTALERVGRFDEDLVRNQDDEYNYRVRKFGGRILLSAELPVRYWSRGSIRSLWKQYFQYGVFKVRVLQKHPRQMMLRQFVPPIFAAALIAAAISILFHEAGIWSLVVVVGAYGISNLAAAAMEARRLEPRLWFYLPIAFATLHLSYGFGFLSGLVRFWNRWGEGSGVVGA